MLQASAKILCSLFILCLALMAHASDALIFIRHDRAGPNLPSQELKHPNWILWPAAQLPGSENGLLSICTGLNWEGQPADLEFQSVGPSSWKSVNWSSLKQRGYIQARQSLLGADRPQLLRSPRGTVDETSLLVALGSNPISQAEDLKAATAGQGWYVYEARSWDEVAHLSHQIGGRALVVEYPPLDNSLWTRFWEFGTGWPQSDLSPQDASLRVPGLIPIGRVYNLLRRPERLPWVDSRATVWGGPNQWLSRSLQLSPRISGLLLMTALLTGALGLIAIRRERKDSLMRVAISGVLLFPAADELAMNLAYATGLAGWPALLMASELVLVGAAVGLTSMIRLRDPAARWSIGLFVIGSLVTTFANPIWSDFSPSFRWPVENLSPEVVGAWMGYLAGLFGVLQSLSVGWRRLGVVILLCLSAVSILGAPWWVDPGGLGVIFPALSWIAAVGLSRGWFLPSLTLLSLPFGTLKDGFTWRPYHLIRNLSETKGLNGADWARFLLSPAFLASLFVAAGAFLLADRFVWYRLRQAIGNRPEIVAPLSSGAALTAIAVVNPELLPGAFVLCLGGSLILVSEMI